MSTILQGIESLSEHVNRMVDGNLWRIDAGIFNVADTVERLERRWAKDIETPVAVAPAPEPLPPAPELQTGAKVVSITEQVTGVDAAQSLVEAAYKEAA